MDDNLILNIKEYLNLFTDPISQGLARVEKGLAAIEANMATRSELIDLKNSMDSSITVLEKEIDRAHRRSDNIERKLQIAQWIFNFVTAILSALIIAYMLGWVN